MNQLTSGALVARLGSRLPDEQENVFAVLGEEGIIPPETALRLVGTVRFRNILVLDYLEIDAATVRAHLAERLHDFDDFKRAVAERFLAG